MLSYSRFIVNKRNFCEIATDINNDHRVHKRVHRVEKNIFFFHNVDICQISSRPPFLE